MGGTGQDGSGSADAADAVDAVDAAGAGGGGHGWLVAVQVVALGSHLLPGGPGVQVPVLLRVAGAVSVVTGLGVAGASARALGPDLTPAVAPRPGAPLRTEGVYALSRHPLYAGLLGASAGTVLLRGRASTLLAAVVLAGVLHVKAGAEDRVLAERFGEQWQEWSEEVPRLVGRRRRPARGRPARPSP
ncbi:methyltransferase family protein [Aquipuribacter sp. MA13-6]|uniref:methyltransferase family protein n=1 Tax=unclassified Aquipuribacter TaxID=2635084 RepID=UPI003EEEF03E